MNYLIRSLHRWWLMPYLPWVADWRFARHRKRRTLLKKLHETFATLQHDKKNVSREKFCAPSRENLIRCVFAAKFVASLRNDFKNYIISFINPYLINRNQILLFLFYVFQRRVRGEAGYACTGYARTVSGLLSWWLCYCVCNQ